MHWEPHDYRIYYVNIDLRHQYGISVAESQTFLLAKRLKWRVARRNGCFRSLTLPSKKWDVKNVERGNPILFRINRLLFSYLISKQARLNLSKSVLVISYSTTVEHLHNSRLGDRRKWPFWRGGRYGEVGM